MIFKKSFILALVSLVILSCPRSSIAEKIEFPEYAYPRLTDPPSAPPVEDISKLQLKEIWGLVYGKMEKYETEEKNGFYHVEFEAKDKNNGIYEAKSQMNIKMVMMGKSTEAKAQEIILFNKDLSLISDEKKSLSSYAKTQNFSKVEGDKLKINMYMSGAMEKKDEKTYFLTESIYPCSLIYLLPFLKGIAVGQKYEVVVYDEVWAYHGFKQEKTTVKVESFEKVGGKNCYKITLQIKIPSNTLVFMFWVTPEGELVESLQLNYARGKAYLMNRVKNEGPSSVQKYMIENK